VDLDYFRSTPCRRYLQGQKPQASAALGGPRDRGCYGECDLQRCICLTADAARSKRRRRQKPGPGAFFGAAPASTFQFSAPWLRLGVGRGLATIRLF